MNRRTLLAGGLCAALLARATGKPRPRVVYIAHSVGAVTRSWYAEHGFVDGRDVEIVAETLAGATGAAMEPRARELLRSRPSVVMLPGWEPIFLFRGLTRDVPLVFVNFGDDPVGLGLVQSLRRPGGNMTGSAQNLMSMTPKLFELLREVRPGGKRGGVLVKESSLRGRHMVQGHQEIERAGRLHDLDIAAIVVPDDPPMAAVRAKLERERVDYLFVTDDLHGTAMMPELLAHLERARIPAIYISPQLVRDGGLMSFTPDFAQGRKNAVAIAARILRGENPGEIPVYQTDRYHVAINRKTARAMGLQVSAALLTRADEVVD
ncbi:MAG: ABC transporter substrate-binding protein [Usitatibacter sp.]